MYMDVDTNKKKNVMEDNEIMLIINERGQKRMGNRLKIHIKNRRKKVWVRGMEKYSDVKSEGESK